MCNFTYFFQKNDKFLRFPLTIPPPCYNQAKINFWEGNMDKTKGNEPSMVADKDEILWVLDEKGNKIRKEWRKTVHEQELRHNEITLWVIDKANKKILVQRRSPIKRLNPNKLGLCAGHVVEDESITTALGKEAREELGLDLTKYKVFPLTTIKRDEKNNHCFSHQFYIFENKPAHFYTIQDSELSEVFYMDYEQFKNLIVTESDEVSYKASTGQWDKAFAKLDKVMGLDKQK